MIALLMLCPYAIPRGFRTSPLTALLPQNKMHNENAIHYMEKKWNSTNLINDKNQNPSKMLTMHQVFLPLPQVRASKS